MLHKLFKIIEKRKQNPKDISYTNQLFVSGQDKIVQKVGEEAVEVLVAAGNQTNKRIIEESADLIYHLFVLLVYKGISIKDIENELESRHKATDNK